MQQPLRVYCSGIAVVSLVLLLLNAFSNDPLVISLRAVREDEWSSAAAATLSHASHGQPVMVNLHKEVQNYTLGERGYTMCVSEDPAMLTSAKYILRQFRTEWRSSLPLAIAHCSELSQATTDELHRIHRESATEQFGRNLTLLSSAALQIMDICLGRDVSLAQKKRLRGWFCKTAALLDAPFRQTMLIDTDIIWFKSPDLLFSASQYQKTGGLFFRDRLLHEVTGSDSAGLQYSSVKAFIEHHSGVAIDGPRASRLLGDGRTSVNYFWRRGAADRGLRHVQESSVVLIDRTRLPRTMAVLRRLLPSFRLGYGDKEIYWIAATIAGEAFAFEPHLSGVYGDCGEVVHFDPLRGAADGGPESEHATPFFMNGQYLSESVEFEAKGVQSLMSKPTRATLTTPLVALGARDPVTGGNCGACAAMGCQRVPTDVSAAIIRQQQFQLKHVDPGFKHSLLGWAYFTWRRVTNKILPAS